MPSSNLHIPRTFKKAGDRAFLVACPRSWNSLPYNIRSINSLNQFKGKRKTHMFSSTYCFPEFSYKVHCTPWEHALYKSYYHYYNLWGRKRGNSEKASMHIIILNSKQELLLQMGLVPLRHSAVFLFLVHPKNICPRVFSIQILLYIVHLAPLLRKRNALGLSVASI